MADAGPWLMWAHQYKGGGLFNIGGRWWVEIHGLPDPVVPVLVTEVADDAPDATHWGWVESESTAAVYGREVRTRPCMMWPHLTPFSMQFPYGPDAEVKAGKGRVVRLKITRREDAPGD